MTSTATDASSPVRSALSDVGGLRVVVPERRTNRVRVACDGRLTDDRVARLLAEVGFPVVDSRPR